jgi:putative sugar O-methyltransferase
MRLIIYLNILLSIWNTAFAEEFDADHFRNWWHSYRQQANIPEELKQMEDYFVSSGLLDHSSHYWNFLNRKNIEQIVQFGLDNFRQTVAQNYFTWLVNSSHGYAKNLFSTNKVRLKNAPKSELYKKHAFFTYRESFQHNQITALLYSYINESGGGAYLSQLEEPFFGNPPSITLDGKAISQDLLNGLLEYMAISNQCDMSKVSTILELGAGSGRTAYCFLKLLPKAKYIIVDIPPALFISQSYLAHAFPEKKVFTFCPFETFEEISEKFNAADLIFITPDQLKILHNRSIDLFLAIDCLHEMRREEIIFYFEEAARLTSFFYFKCWTDTIVPFDNIHYLFTEYPVPANWKKCFQEPCFVPSDFSHALYKIPLD